MNNFDIDIVVLWVDGSDPEWIKTFNQYAPKDKQKGIDINHERYRDNGLFKFWFRGIEKNAPWVRKIHFVTSGQKPEWLNINHPKLNWVKHEDYIPKEYLPTFSSHPIELFINRIPDLAEHFIYFNDDIYLINKSSPNDFFKKGLPILNAEVTLGWLKYDDNIFSQICFNDIRLINKHFKFRYITKKTFKWFINNRPKNSVKNFLYLPQQSIPGFSTRHTANPYLKSILNEVWEKETSVLLETCKNRFRSQSDVNQYLFYFWHLCTNTFHPKLKKDSKYYGINTLKSKDIKKSLYNRKTKIICINDDSSENLIELYNQIYNLFQEKFPEKSSFEI